MNKPGDEDDLEQWAPRPVERTADEDYFTQYLGVDRPPVTEPAQPPLVNSFDPKPVRVQMAIAFGAGLIFLVVGIVILLSADNPVEQLAALFLALGLGWPLVALIYRQLALGLHLFQSGTATLGVVEAHGLLIRYRYDVDGRTLSRRQWLTNTNVDFIPGDHIWVLYDDARPRKAAPTLWVRQIVLVDSGLPSVDGDSSDVA